MITIHSLKIAPVYFDLVKSGFKTYEIRKNDRDFECGQIVNLRDYNKTTGYSGRNVFVRITHITFSSELETVGISIPSDVVILSFKLI